MIFMIFIVSPPSRPCRGPLNKYVFVLDWFLPSKDHRLRLLLQRVSGCILRGRCRTEMLGVRQQIQTRILINVADVVREINAVQALANSKLSPNLDDALVD